ncbi:MAG: GntR family transcriptional regulator [Verrucomicrobiota bacterium]
MPSHSADEIRKSLEQCIIEREFANGERLDEVRLAARYGVSRTPLREALRLLAGSGLVEIIACRGAYVRYPSIVEIVEMFEVMAELEAFCGRLAAQRMTSNAMASLTIAAHACKQAHKENNPDGYYHCNEEFHRLIYQASGNSFLALEAERLQKRLRPFRRMQLRARGRMTQSLNEHTQILKALVEGDSKAAAAALRDHVVVQAEKFHTLFATYESELAGKSA